MLGLIPLRRCVATWVGDVEFGDGGLFSLGAAAIIPRRGADVGMAHQLLDGDDVSAGVEQVAGKGALRSCGENSLTPACAARSDKMLYTACAVMGPGPMGSCPVALQTALLYYLGFSDQRPV